MPDPSEPTALYDAAVGDGTTQPRESDPDDEPVVVESNASNYGASAVTPQHVVEDEP